MYALQISILALVFIRVEVTRVGAEAEFMLTSGGGSTLNRAKQPTEVTRVGAEAESTLTSGGGSTLNRVKQPTFEFLSKPDTFTPVFPLEPTANTASVNAGDDRLYVGGAQINKAFQQALNLTREQGHTEYPEVHRALLELASKTPAKLASSFSPDFKARASLKSVKLIGSFARVPASGASGPTGVAWLDVFMSEARPNNDHNVAMLYIVGPRATGTKAEFLSAVETMAENAFLTVTEYHKWLASTMPARTLPHIDEVQFVLVSGGSYKHQESSKLDVAKATVSGMMKAGQSSEPTLWPVVRFAYDEDVFQNAVKALGAP